MLARLVTGALALMRARSHARRPWHGVLVGAFEPAPRREDRREASRHAPGVPVELLPDHL